MPDSRILRDTPATLSATFYDGGESAIDPGAVTVTITRADGTALVTNAATSGATTAPRTYALPAQADLDYLTAVWSGGSGRKLRTYHEIVGGFFVSLAEIRAFKNLSDQVKFTTAELEAARTWFEDLAETYCSQAFVPRYARVTLDGPSSSRLYLNPASSAGRPFTAPLPLRRLLSVTIGGVAVSADDLALWDVYDQGFIDRLEAGGIFTWGRNNIVVAYEHGEDGPSEELRQAALTAIRSRLLTNEAGQIQDRSLSITNEFGNVLIAQPGSGRPTGLPEVNAVLNRLRVPVLA